AAASSTDRATAAASRSRRVSRKATAPPAHHIHRLPSCMTVHSGQRRAPGSLLARSKAVTSQPGTWLRARPSSTSQLPARSAAARPAVAATVAEAGCHTGRGAAGGPASRSSASAVPALSTTAPYRPRAARVVRRPAFAVRRRRPVGLFVALDRGVRIPPAVRHRTNSTEVARVPTYSPKASEIQRDWYVVDAE